MPKSAWRRRRIGLILGGAGALILGLAGGTVLSLAVLSILNGTLLAILGGLMGVALILAVPGTRLLIRANQELQQSGELDFKAMREKNAAASRKRSNRILIILPAYAVFLLLVNWALALVGDGGVVPRPLGALILGLLAFQFVLELAKRRLAAKRDAGE